MLNIEATDGLRQLREGKVTTLTKSLPKIGGKETQKICLSSCIREL